MHIRKANTNDIDAVEQIYDEIHLEEETGRLTVGWIRGVYPIRKTAEDAVKREDLFVIEDDNEITGAAIINRIQVDVYENAPWKYPSDADKVCVIHTLVISPRHFGKGYGIKMVSFFEDYANEHGWNELRLDTNERNFAARKMYSKLGYEEIAVIPTVFNNIPNVNLVLLEKFIFPADDLSFHE